MFLNHWVPILSVRINTPLHDFVASIAVWFFSGWESILVGVVSGSASISCVMPEKRRSILDLGPEDPGTRGFKDAKSWGLYCTAEIQLYRRLYQRYELKLKAVPCTCRHGHRKKYLQQTVVISNYPLTFSVLRVVGVAKPDLYRQSKSLWLRKSSD